MNSKQENRVTITISTTDKQLKTEVHKHFKILSAILGKNQDVVLLEALREFRKKIEELEKIEYKNK